MLDRGPTLDWFSAPEIWIEGLSALGGLWVFLVQTFTARHPFFDRALALDRNFVTCNVFGFFIGIFLFSTMALLPPVMQGPMGYSVFGAGLVMMPRGLGSFMAMFVVGPAGRPGRHPPHPDDRPGAVQPGAAADEPLRL